MQKPSLVVLAAGLGSRYGSLKQIDKFGLNGETIVDYAIYDAIKAGFDKVVFVISAGIVDDFQRIFLDKLKHHAQVEYVVQELAMLPAHFTIPPDRVKPWGTAHAVLTATEKINEPFAIVNADDFYGRGSLQVIYEHLKTMENTKLQACLVGFTLEKTLSENGRVSRGICSIAPDQTLEGIVERTHIFKNPDVGAYFIEGDQRTNLSGKETVSMNLMGFTSPVFRLMEEMFEDFLREEGAALKSEFYIPSVLNQTLAEGVTVPVLTSDEEWFGVTYKEDKPIAQKRIHDLIDQGIYPPNLWQ